MSILSISGMHRENHVGRGVGRSGWRAGLRLVSALLLTLCAPAQASDFAERTHLIGVDLGTPLSEIPRIARSSGYELSDRTPVRFDLWYRDRVPNLQLDFMTEITQDLGLLWGVGTGEYGEKYRIDPSLRVGLIYTRPVSRTGVLSARLTTRLGGLLRERSCTADYGEIGGVQRVNCRLAATPLDPVDTLDYLWNERPGDRFQASISLLFRF